MNAPFQHIPCRLSTLSPLHLGCGEDYQPTGYVIHDGYLHAFAERQLLHALGAADIKKLEDLAQLGDMDSIQRLIHRHAKSLALRADHSVWVQPDIERFYEKRITGKESNQLIVLRTFYNHFNQQPVIPGSAVKGAIRTAWLDQLNDGKTQLSDGEKYLRDFKRFNALQQRLMAFEHVDEDPFYLLKVGDAAYRHELPASEIWYAVSRKRMPKSELSNKPKYLPELECIGAARRHAFELDLRLLDGSLRQTSRRVPQTPAELAAACNRYYLPRLRRELYQLGEQRDYLDRQWCRTIARLLDGELGAALEGNRAILLRLGKHGGAEDKTLDGLRSIKIMMGKGKPAEWRAGTTEIRLAAADRNQQQGLLPFGWVLLEFADAPLPQTHAALDELAAPARARAAGLRHWQQLREQARLAAERSAAEARERESARAAEREAEARRAQALANLSDEQRRIAELAGQLAGDQASRGKGLGSPLGQALRETVLAAETWGTPDRAALRELLGRCFEHLGVDRRKNTKAREFWQKLGENA
ncbi:type III-A CRISPR-associated RAMP protein Csm5 [Azotobacter salinestris]|uniref:type III-A CRISPR-associated RAMP protein Csm5 n=1 Tax=Azotobacter salinestris TaxID=69964 RepID=UPI0032DF89F1